MAPLEKRPLGRNGPLVSKQGLGCMGLSGLYASALELTEEQKIAFLKKAVSEGVTLFNSANIYVGPTGHNEELLGKAFKDLPRDQVFIATKFGLELPSFTPHLKREEVRGHAEAALARLGFSYVDLFITCRMDKTVPIEETMEGLKELVKEGKIKHIGLSECSAKQLRRAHAVHPITAIEVEYSIWSRGIEAEILPTARELGVAVLAYSPLGRGFLTGSIKSADDLPKEGPFMGKDWRVVGYPRAEAENIKANQRFVDALAKAAAEKGCSTAQLALAWVHAQGDDIFPIPGTTKEKNLLSNLAAANIKLTAAEAAELAALIPEAEVAGARYNHHGLAMTHEGQTD